MKTDTLRLCSVAHMGRNLFFMLLLWSVFHALSAHALTINVVDQNGMPVSNFRWLVEEDATKESIPGQLAGADNLSLNFHTSYMPVVAAGRVGVKPKGPALADLPLDSTKRHYISVLPDGGGYQMGGASLPAGQGSVTVVVNKTPIPTAQISVFVFNDNWPINGAPDLPQEVGLEGFSILLKEAGGTFGQSGGQVTQDAFGNPIGTTYQQDASGNFIFENDAPKVLVLGNGFISSGADGVVRIKYLAPAKYTVEVVPPAGSDWHQTSTIEGTKGIDAWVKANEPSFFQEFGPPGHHVDFGFVKTLNDTSVLSGGSTISGKIVNQHMSRPPDFSFYNGAPVPNCWVGLNELPVVGGRGVYSKKCNADSTFSIPNVPAGTYQLVIWDEFLDRIIASTNVTVPAGGGAVDLLDVPVFDWFGHFKARVFFDTIQAGDTTPNGFRDANEIGLQDQALNLRFRDGSIYQSTATNAQGEAEFSEVFPFFNWLVAEVDFARFKATGTTLVVDNGGPVAADDGWAMPSRNALTPQLQECMPGDVEDGVPECPTAGGPRINPNTGNALSRTDTGPILTQGIATFLGQTNLIEWGKTLYTSGENGGVSGMVQYATVRAEEDPRYAAAENWEPGIPRVQVNLYKDCDMNGIPDKPGCTPATGQLPATGLNPTRADVQLADVDNHPFGWSEGGAKGAEDVDRNGNDTFDQGDAFDIATTDSWDDSLPSGCQGAPFVSTSGVTTDCYDGLRNFNQMRPAVFDGGFAFGGPAGKPELAVGTYIVEAVTPPGYETVKELDKNVDFGDSYTPSPLLLPPVCVGDDNVIPVDAELELMPGVISAYAGQTRPLCDRKSIEVKQGQNAGVNFFMFTEVPVAGHIVGFILDDTANEFDPNAPTFGEKHAPPHVPVSIRDWTGREISRVYSDQWGTYNALAPSSYSVNLPFPSGVSPNMLTTCMNHPGPIEDTRVGSPTFGQMIIDPYFDRQYSQFCYTFQYLPGKTTYLDTPVLPVAAFAGAGQFPLDCEYPNGTPVIYSVEGKTASGASQSGPYVPRPPTSCTATSTGSCPTLTLVAAGMVDVTNPAYDGTSATAPTIPRNFGFGANTGVVRFAGKTLPIKSWSDGIVEAYVPYAVTTSASTIGQLELTSASGHATKMGVNVTIGKAAGMTVRTVAPGTKIQTQIDAAFPGDLILVPPGIYDEVVIMNKKVSLQGWGAPATMINAAKFPAEKTQAWRDKINLLLAANAFDLLPGQEAGFNGPNNEPLLFGAEEAPGILVVARASGAQAFNNTRNARIDGFTITGAENGGGIFVNGYARFLEISNNKLISNYGNYGGGIRVGHPNLIDPTVVAADDNLDGGYVNAQNNNVRIHHNHITQNGGGGETGGGVSLCTGSDNYQVTSNYICGNHSMGNGAGIGHLGRSNNGLIASNTVIFNQSFNQGLGVSGGGIFVGGQATLAPVATTGLSPGSGNVTVSANLIQGNLAGAGDGGGIRAEFVNGLDVLRTPGNPALWYQLNVANNMVVDNIAGMAGGGISLQDVVKSAIVNNTIANNDSTATAGAAFAANSPNQSTAQPAGIVSRAHSTLLYSTIGAGSGYKIEYANPTLANNIVWHNRSFYWVINEADPADFGLWPDVRTNCTSTRCGPPVYRDLAVLGTSNPAHQLNPRYSLLTDLTGYGGANNITGDPRFVWEYINGDQGQTIQQVELTTSIATAPAFDEGGNFIDVRFGPLTPTGDYHLKVGSPALAKGTLLPEVAPLIDYDYDGQRRSIPTNSLPDMGADERK